MIEATEKYEQNTRESMHFWETFWDVPLKEIFQDKSRASVENWDLGSCVAHTLIFQKQLSDGLCVFCRPVTK